jgi:hypothetical protein
MRDWFDKADPDFLKACADTPASGTYQVPFLFAFVKKTYEEFTLGVEATAQEGQSVLDVMKTLHACYLTGCTEEGIEPRFMMAVSSFDDKGNIFLEDLFFWAQWNPALVLRKKMGRARGTYKVQGIAASSADHARIEKFDLERTAQPGETIFHVLYGLNRDYVAESLKRGLAPDEEFFIEDVTRSKFVVMGH